MTESRKVRVLLADDEKHVRQLVKAVLIPFHCEIVAEAENGAQAVDLYRELRPDVVLLDINMPVKDGREALRQIIAFDPEAVVVMLTSMSDLASIQGSLDEGATHYIRKDTPPAEMRELLSDVWKEHFQAAPP
ncbi:response regulator transcription factor [Dyella sp. RRB7]|uniref:response regulator transcription factor n=1 Tax=Dyella sp. RRB7 TaxID=2919502 RepID=UPI001FAA36D1|nr:response regulator transcription factor [Dyella sp. RRB7]